jgi:hypothetical protein
MKVTQDKGNAERDECVFCIHKREAERVRGSEGRKE